MQVQDEVNNGMAAPAHLDLASFWPHWNRSRVGMDMANMSLALVSCTEGMACERLAYPCGGHSRGALPHRI